MPEMRKRQKDYAWAAGRFDARNIALLRLRSDFQPAAFDVSQLVCFCPQTKHAPQL
jgi:hypothetical protein